MAKLGSSNRAIRWNPDKEPAEPGSGSREARRACAKEGHPYKKTINEETFCAMCLKRFPKENEDG